MSLTEYAVLGVLAEGPTHGFEISKVLGSEGGVGRVMAVRRPLVYRAIDRLVEEELAKPLFAERGIAGPQRVIHAITPRGRRVLNAWLGEPVEHVRDLRLEFVLKVVLLKRRGSSPLRLIKRQREKLHSTFTAYETSDSVDHIELWRHHTALAAAAYLEDLESRHLERI